MPAEMTQPIPITPANDSEAVETPEVVAARIRAALKFIDAKRLVPAPDCGMKYLSRETAFGKLKALSEGARRATERLW